jgi:FAD:protein FMN transferase
MTSTSTRTSSPVHRKVAQLMGMPISLALRGRQATDERSAAAWDEALAILREVDRVFSTYRPDSFVSRLGRGEIRLDDCPPEVAEVLRLGELARVQSDGAFNVLRAGADGQPVLDPSGVVKGWAVERAARVFESLEGTDYCLSAGGDMVCRVVNAAAPAWRIGIEDPRRSNRILAVVPVRNGAVATSGLNHRGAHILDARTGEVPSGVASVSVIGDSLTWADIDATAAFAHGRNALRWLSTRPARQGVVVWDDGTAETYRTAAA